MFLNRFERAQLADMLEPDGSVSVTCEFCSTKYVFALDEVGYASGDGERPAEQE